MLYNFLTSVAFVGFNFAFLALADTKKTETSQKKFPSNTYS